MSEQVKELDVCGMSCPMPLIHIRMAIDSMSEGHILRITGDDPMFEESINDFCEENNYQLVDISKEQNKTIAEIKV